MPPIDPALRRPGGSTHAVPAPSAPRALMSRLALLGVLVPALAGCARMPVLPTFAAQVGATLPSDPFNPVQLNEAAVASAARGDVESAWLMLERAARLAPHDERIAANLAAVRTWRDSPARGKVVGVFVPKAALRRPPPLLFSDAAPAPLPPIWPARADAASR